MSISPYNCPSEAEIEARREPPWVALQTYKINSPSVLFVWTNVQDVEAAKARLIQEAFNDNGVLAYKTTLLASVGAEIQRGPIIRIPQRIIDLER